MRKKLIIPKKYNSSLNLRETEIAIKFIKDSFQNKLANALNLTRVSAPIAVLKRTGINDYLSGVEKPVNFFIKDIEEEAEIVQSLAKWKRAALADYGFKNYEGLYTDMNAIRPDEHLDNMHSVYVDQWDWELIMTKEQRNLDFLKTIVEKIYEVIKTVEKLVIKKFLNEDKTILPDSIEFIHSQELEDIYPDLTPQEREDAICRQKKAVFIIGIGSKLNSGSPHDQRAPDYDDWSTDTGYSRKGLNGDILVWYPLLNCAMELSSMGIRVNKESLLEQLKLKGETDKISLDYHQRVLNEEVPLTIGGGIGQSRLCMFFLRKAHIGEVQSCIWPDKVVSKCKKNNIFIL